NIILLPSRPIEVCPKPTATSCIWSTPRPCLLPERPPLPPSRAPPAATSLPRAAGCRLPPLRCWKPPPFPAPPDDASLPRPAGRQRHHDHPPPCTVATAVSPARRRYTPLPQRVAATTSLLSAHHPALFPSVDQITSLHINRCRRSSPPSSFSSGTTASPCSHLPAVLLLHDDEDNMVVRVQSCRARPPFCLLLRRGAVAAGGTIAPLLFLSQVFLQQNKNAVQVVSCSSSLVG
ncbi:nuclear pore complex-interacting protein family member B13-like, partial [Triticum aestivum]|uniref:nuclear pore complex-interacting protein family member B13-like n=1 Tax=Triticum aestivum TaxID=4565 RepID=UPI001D01B55E